MVSNNAQGRYETDQHLIAYILLYTCSVQIRLRNSLKFSQLKNESYFGEWKLFKTRKLFGESLQNID